MKRIARFVIFLLAAWLAFELAAHLIGEMLWFQEVGYLSTWLKRLQTQFGLWVVVISISALFFLGNLQLAQRLKGHFISKVEQRNAPTSVLPPSQSRAIRLPLLLLIVLGCELLIGLMLLYYSQAAHAVWQVGYSLPTVTPPLSPFFKLQSLGQVLLQIYENIWQLGALLGVVILLLVNAQFWLKAIAIALSLALGWAIAGNWTIVLPAFYSTAFNQSDPLLGRDISFYIFYLPLWKLLDFWLGGLCLYSLLAVALIYLLSGDSLSQGKFPGFSQSQLRHLSALGGGMVLVLAERHWLARYELLYSPRGVTFGASYTDVKVQLPLETVLGILAGAIALWLFWKAICEPQKKKINVKIVRKAPKYAFKGLPFAVYLAVLIAGSFTGVVVQQLSVQPNELAREKPFIERSIAMTRAAFNLSQIEVKTFDPKGKLTAADIKNNPLTIDNIRLWDARPLQQTNRQLQQIRLYYKFPDADIDRYNLKLVQRGQPDSKPPQIREKLQQVIVAARELDYSAVPKSAKTWVNEHLVYTHGYGFTLSPVNSVGEGGLPYYFVKDIGTETERDTLRIANELIEESIPIGKPRIYYGELTNTHVMTSTKVREFDFPSGEDNVYNIYDGTGGIPIGTHWRRLLLATYLKDWRMLFTQNFTPDTRLLLRRNINQRIRAIAPFLQYDRDPYLVIADAGDARQAGSENYLHWIVDAYTTSAYYPYSDPGKNPFSYIRNSVKVVIDAYNGDVQFYVADPDDPIVQTWTKIFPELFQPLDAMPVRLHSHIRYPKDLYGTQSERLLSYHMTDPQVFYNREDQWQLPQEIYANKPLPVEPYYLIMELPTATSAEFILLYPYTPTSRNNLIAILFGRSDGSEYGKLLLYLFPKQKLAYGPEQIEARINQDPTISQQISLWNREGSRAIQGNLLVIPIEESVLYVEPLYLEAEYNSLPTLARVIVVYEDKIAMEETLQRSLEKIFGSA